MSKWISKWVPRWMAKWLGLTVSVAVIVVLTAGCAQQPSAVAATIEDKTYSVTPASVKVKAGIVTGEIGEMKVTEQIEKGSDRVVSPAKLSGKVTLKNVSTNQTVRLVAGKIRYVGRDGQPIKLEEARSEPALKFAAYGGSDRLDPGQEASQSLEVDFPAAALKAKTLKEIRLDLTYIPSPYHEEKASFAVVIGDGK